MTNQQVEQGLIQFFEGVGFHEAARLIRESGSGGHSVRWGATGEVFNSEGEPDYVEEAREQARRFCEAKAEKHRPVRPVDESNRSAVEGHKAALSFLEKKKRSAIRK